MSTGSLQSLINGQQAQLISVRDRGFQYGDGCFETIRVVANKAILLSEHLQRLKHACTILSLAIDIDVLQHEISQILAAQEVADAVLKISISRGEGGRGYAPLSAPDCTRVLQLYDYECPDTHCGAKTIVCTHRLSSNAQLAGIKHLNRLDQVLASAQVPPQFDEGLCLDQEGFLVEGCKSNLVIRIDDALLTPELNSCGVQGVMLNYLASYFAKTGHSLQREKISLQRLQAADEIFLCNSVFGVWPVVEVCNEKLETHWTAEIGPQARAAMKVADGLSLNVK